MENVYEIKMLIEESATVAFLLSNFFTVFALTLATFIFASTRKQTQSRYMVSRKGVKMTLGQVKKMIPQK